MIMSVLRFILRYHYLFAYYTSVSAAVVVGQESILRRTGDGSPMKFALMVCLIILSMYWLRHALFRDRLLDEKENG